MSDTNWSSKSDFSDSFSEEEARIHDTIQKLCILCMVKLNIIGISHTRSTNCEKCHSIICINCLAKNQEFPNYCKICYDKQALVTEDFDIRELRKEIWELKAETLKEKTKKEIVIAERAEIVKSIREIKKNQDEDFDEYGAEIKNLKIRKEKLETVVSDMQKQLDKETQEFVKKNLELTDAQNSLESVLKQTEVKDFEISSIKRTTAVYKMDASLLIESLRMNPKVLKKYSILKEIQDLNSSFLQQMEKNVFFNETIEKIRIEIEEKKKNCKNIEKLIEDDEKSLPKSHEPSRSLDFSPPHKGLHKPNKSLTFDDSTNNEAISPIKCKACMLF